MPSLAIAIIGFAVWGHHMFVSGQSAFVNLVFSFLSFIVAVPSAIKVFNWTATLYRGQITFEAPMHPVALLHLPPTFCCGLIFFELRQKHQFSEAAMNGIVSVAAIQLRGFFGGIILRGEGKSKEVTGKLSPFRSETPSQSIIGKTKASLLGDYGRGKTTKIADNLHFGSILLWGEPNFAQFGLDVIAMTQGTYEAGRLSSFHGLGASEWEQLKVSQPQSRATKSSL